MRVRICVCAHACTQKENLWRARLRSRLLPKITKTRSQTHSKSQGRTATVALSTNANPAKILPPIHPPQQAVSAGRRLADAQHLSPPLVPPRLRRGPACLSHNGRWLFDPDHALCTTDRGSLVPALVPHCPLPAACHAEFRLMIATRCSGLINRGFRCPWWLLLGAQLFLAFGVWCLVFGVWGFAVLGLVLRAEGFVSRVWCLASWGPRALVSPPRAVTPNSGFPPSCHPKQRRPHTLLNPKPQTLNLTP